MKVFACVAVIAIGAVGCDNPFAGRNSESSKPSRPAAERTVVNDFFQLKDGQGRSWKVEAGSYRLELTATNDGASVAWLGGACQGAKETRVYNSNCTLTQDGQLQIHNPTTFGLGDSTSVTLKLVALP